VLADLLAAIDQSREPDLGAARLIEVLAGRPLYIAGADPVTDESSLSIDLTGHQDENTLVDLVAIEDDSNLAAAASLPIARLPRPAVVPIKIKVAEPVGARRWERALSNISLPAAAVLLLLAVGGGVSAAVTGNPMAPVDGITRVVAQLPGVDDGSLDRVKTEISAAEVAALRSDAPGAYMHLQRARAGLDDVPAAAQPDLNQLIDRVEEMVPTTAAPLPSGEPGTGVPAGSGPVPTAVATSSAPVVKPSETTAPSASATAVPVTKDPTPDPAPTTSEPEDEPAPSTQAAAEPTPAAAASSP
jgi:hypothetical protein